MVGGVDPGRLGGGVKMVKRRLTIVAMVLLASAMCLLLGAAARQTGVAGGATNLVANAPEAGLLAIAGPVSGRIRVLFARNGGVGLLREISVPGSGHGAALSLSGG